MWSVLILFSNSMVTIFSQVAGSRICRKGAGWKVLTAHLVWIVEYLMLTGKLEEILAAWGLVVATYLTSQFAPSGVSYDFVAARSGTFDHIWTNC